MQKKYAFSMMDLLVAMIVACLILVCSLPFMTQRAKKTSEENFGEFICYAAYKCKEGESGDSCWHLYQRERYNSDILSDPVEVEECKFEPVSSIKSYNVKIIGGGGGGSAASYVDTKIEQKQTSKSVIDLNNENVIFKNPFKNLSDEVFVNNFLNQKFGLCYTGKKDGDTTEKIYCLDNFKYSNYSSPKVFEKKDFTKDENVIDDIACKGNNFVFRAYNDDDKVCFYNLNSLTFETTEDIFSGIKVGVGGSVGVVESLSNVDLAETTIKLNKGSLTSGSYIGIGGSGETYSALATEGKTTQFTGHIAGGGGIKNSQLPNKATYENDNDKYLFIKGISGDYISEYSRSGARPLDFKQFLDDKTLNPTSNPPLDSDYGSGGSGGSLLINYNGYVGSHYVLNYKNGKIDYGTKPTASGDSIFNVNDVATISNIKCGNGSNGAGGAIIISW